MGNALQYTADPRRLAPRCRVRPELSRGHGEVPLTFDIVLLVGRYFPHCGERLA